MKKQDLDIAVNGMFHTYETSEELFAYFNKFIGEEKRLLIMGAMFMNNLMAAQLNGKYVEK